MSFKIFSALMLFSSLGLAGANVPEEICRGVAYPTLSKMVQSSGCTMSQDPRDLKIESSQYPSDRFVVVTYSAEATCQGQKVQFSPVSASYDRETGDCQ